MHQNFASHLAVDQKISFKFFFNMAALLAFSADYPSLHGTLPWLRYVTHLAVRRFYPWALVRTWDEIKENWKRTKFEDRTKVNFI